QSPDIIFSMAIQEQPTVHFLSRSPEQTRRVGARLGAALRAGDVVCLQGDLGAGKTTFVQGVAEGWGSVDAVSSPTFVIVNVYRTADGKQLFHLDAYRLESTLEAEELDLNAMLAQGPLLIEWPERMVKLIPNDRLWVRLEHVHEEEREMNFNSQGKHYDDLLDVIRRGVYGAE
ncbi:MAG TPA: tRNA (adenosine(37)-N6)-threonylcarbamoyltransferase complex ATPase subunit type 1 TsaE, partial [Anaerolineales bacterium]|nr:tRNA (adenosine(37)-N6)-threonylcarbamoyltransferase complex ATPase subunit type 1 TsaE [Anaerolineales bacterium]